jgi:hypothetical protein
VTPLKVRKDRAVPEQAIENVKKRIDKQKTAVGMVFVGIVAAAALFKQKQARKAAARAS